MSVLRSLFPDTGFPVSETEVYLIDMAYSNITKTAMADSMEALMEEKPFAKISVGDICERCGMNRKSFYYHFKDKYDLVNWIFQTEFLEMMQRRDYSSGWELLSDICAYFYAERAFYTNALQVEGQNAFRDYFAEAISSVLAEIMRDQIGPGEDSRFFVQFLTDAFQAAILRWLKQTPVLPPDEFLQKLESVMNILRK